MREGFRKVRGRNSAISWVWGSSGVRYLLRLGLLVGRAMVHRLARGWPCAGRLLAVLAGAVLAVAALLAVSAFLAVAGFRFGLGLTGSRLAAWGGGLRLCLGRLRALRSGAVPVVVVVTGGEVVMVVRW